MLEPRITLLTGDRQIGKSTVCLKLVEKLRQRDFEVSGLITRRTGAHDLQVTEIHSETTYPLTLPHTSDTGLIVGHFRMAPDAMTRSTKSLDACFPTQVFILDEIGPLELVRGQGWARALKLLEHFTYCVAFIVVRPELLARAIWQLPMSFFTVVHVTAESRDMLPSSLLTVAANACSSPEYEAIGR